MSGEAFVLVGAMLFGASNITLRRGMTLFPGDNGYTISVFISAATTGTGALLTRPDGVALAQSGLAYFLFAGVFTTLLGRASQFGTIRLIGPARASVFKVAAPALSVAIAVPLLRESLTVGDLLGAAVVLLGLAALSWEAVRREVGGHHTTGASGEAWQGYAATASLSLAEGCNRSDSSASRRTAPTGTGLGLLMSVFFALGLVFRKLGLLQIPWPMLGAAIGSTIALVGGVFAELLSGQWRERWRKYREVFPWPFILAGLLASVGQMSVFVGIERSQVSGVAILLATESLWTLLFGRVVRAEEAVTLWVITSAITVFAGTVLVVLM